MRACTERGRPDLKRLLTISALVLRTALAALGGGGFCADDPEAAGRAMICAMGSRHRPVPPAFPEALRNLGPLRLLDHPRHSPVLVDMDNR